MPGADALTASDLDYTLPEALIAQHPAPERDRARLLSVARGGGVIGHHHVRDLPELVRPALWVLNDTRVLPSRLFGEKASGGRVELLLVERLEEGTVQQRWLAMGRASKALKPGNEVTILGAQLSATVVERRADGMLDVRLSAPDGVAAAIEQAGHVPLPPYIRRADERSDRERYQTVYAVHEGAIAAPTAGLHLTQALLDRLVSLGHELTTLTLHVGPGTFAPLKGESLDEHTMHAERYEIPEAAAAAVARARERGLPVLAVGTTVVRALESAARADRTVAAGEGRTSLFIRPPRELVVVDAMLTNFHLPRSTLLALVMAFAGIETTRQAYRIAVDAGYRFYSYGDAMLIGGQRG